MGNTQSIETNAEWCHLVRATNFHNEAPSKDHEAKLLPSFRALSQHKHRAEYVLHMVYSAPHRTCSQLQSFVAYGWNIDNDGGITIAWGDIHCDRYLSIAYEAGCSCTKGGCTARCKCLLSNRPCTIRCKCRHTCKNPFNAVNMESNVQEGAGTVHRKLQDLNVGDTESEHNNGQESMDELSTDSENSDTELTIGAEVTLTDYARD